MTGNAMFVCPGGRIRGAGYVDNAAELMCGTYTVAPASLPDCSDKVGCFPSVQATVKDTLIIGGQSDVEPSYSFKMLMRSDHGKGQLWRPAACKDGSSGWAVVERVAVDATDDYCVSPACPAGGSGGGGGGATCGTDCDCGHCWYCEKSGGSGTCRYGGEGPYGCYRGCN